MSSVIVEISAIVLLILVNGALAMSETAVVASRHSRLASRAQEGDARYRAALRLKDEPTHFLSTVQIGISLVGVLAGALGGARLAGHLSPQLARVGWLAPYAEIAAIAIVVALVTYVSLVVGELVPKRLALSSPERIASLVARPMHILSRATKPVVLFVSASTRAALAPFSISTADQTDVTEEDIRAMIAQGTATGVVHETEQDILERVFLLGDRRVSGIMTPRQDVDWLDIHARPDEVREHLGAAPHSRYLLCDGSIDRVVGVLRTRDLLDGCLRGQPLELGTLMHQPLFVRDTMPVLRLLEQFRRSEVAIAVVLDESRALRGVATLGDVLQDLVSDIPGRQRPTDLAVRRADGAWLMDGAMLIEDVTGRLELAEGALAARSASNTLAGLVMTHTGHVPSVGEQFTLRGFRFEVVDMDGRRIDRVLVTPASPR